jgi:hypothetical protein
MESSAALNRLADEISSLRDACWQRRSCRGWLREAWHPASRLAVFPASSFLFCLLLFLSFLGMCGTVLSIGLSIRIRVEDSDPDSMTVDLDLEYKFRIQGQENEVKTTLLVKFFSIL